MEYISESNLVRLCGSPAGRPAYSHTSRGQDFFRLPLAVRRLSGAEDTLNLLVRRAQLEALTLPDRPERLRVIGEVRSYNNRKTQGARLVISVLAQELRFCEDEDENRVWLRGTLCRAPVLRRTPLGREICDLLLAVNRRFGRSDYLPCICWGRLAREAAPLAVGTPLHLAGRLQSRPYLKMTEDGPVQRVAYEVSAAELEIEN